MYGVEYFTMPEPYNFGEELIKVPGLDGTGKMGKSEGNGIYLSDEPEVIRKKVMRAVTDAGPQKPNSPMAGAGGQPLLPAGTAIHTRYG